MKKQPLFERPWLILCEGRSDKEFFHKLIGNRNVGVGQFEIYFPNRGANDAGGKDKFGQWLLLNYTVRPEFKHNVRAVLIIADNDEDPEASFAGIQNGLRAASFPVPHRAKTVARKDNYPDVVVLGVPDGEAGCLETLCLGAAYNKWNIKEALDTYVAAVPAANWSISKQSKMRIHSTIAATCASQPEVSFTHIWQQAQQYHPPLDDSCFTPLAQFIDGFGALLNDDAA